MWTDCRPRGGVHRVAPTGSAALIACPGKGPERKSGPFTVGWSVSSMVRPNRCRSSPVGDGHRGRASGDAGRLLHRLVRWGHPPEPGDPVRAAVAREVEHHPRPGMFRWSSSPPAMRPDPERDCPAMGQEGRERDGRDLENTACVAGQSFRRLDAPKVAEGDSTSTVSARSGATRSPPRRRGGPHERAEGFRACPTGASPPRRTLGSVIVAAAISYDRSRAD
jgi:hypothetical protein